MNEETLALQVLSNLLGAKDDQPVTVPVSQGALTAIRKLHDAILEKGFDAVVHTNKRDVLKVPPRELTDPSDIRYFQLYRESYTMDHLHAPMSRLPQDGSKMSRPGWTAGGFRSAVKRTMLASRFIHTSAHKAAATADLDAELERITSWERFDVNAVARLSDKQPLLMVGLTALHHFDLLNSFNIAPETAVNFVRAVEHHYMPNPYHNSTHAADVTQALVAMLAADGLDAKFSDLELLAMLLAAIMHDVAHPGFSNGFLTKTQDEQALMYNDQSSNEALSASIGFKILQAQECNVFLNMSRDDFFYIRRLIVEIILGTDMAAHSGMLEAAAGVLTAPDAAAAVWTSERLDARLLAMKSLVHCADISNSCRPATAAGRWTRAVYEEFFKQGDAEKAMGLEVSPLCDRETVGIAESQGVFLSFVVKPAWDCVRVIAPKSHAAAMACLEGNRATWEALAESHDKLAVLHDGGGGDGGGGDGSEPLYIAPAASPFHSTNQNSWGNSDMLLLLLNDEHNAVIGRGIELLSSAKRQQEIAQLVLPRSEATA